MVCGCSSVGADKLIYETTVSTVKDSPEAAARLSKPQFEQERQGHFAQSPARGPQAFDAGLRKAAWPPIRRNVCAMAARCTSGRVATSCESAARGSGWPSDASPPTGSGLQRED